MQPCVRAYVYLPARPPAPAPDWLTEYGGGRDEHPCGDEDGHREEAHVGGALQRHVCTHACTSHRGRGPMPSAHVHCAAWAQWDVPSPHSAPGCVGSADAVPSQASCAQTPRCVLPQAAPGPLRPAPARPAPPRPTHSVPGRSARRPSAHCQQTEWAEPAAAEQGAIACSHAWCCAACTALHGWVPADASCGCCVCWCLAAWDGIMRHLKGHVGSLTGRAGQGRAGRQDIRHTMHAGQLMCR